MLLFCATYVDEEQVPLDKQNFTSKKTNWDKKYCGFQSKKAEGVWVEQILRCLPSPFTYST